MGECGAVLLLVCVVAGPQNVLEKLRRNEPGARKKKEPGSAREPGTWSFLLPTYCFIVFQRILIVRGAPGGGTHLGGAAGRMPTPPQIQASS